MGSPPGPWTGGRRRRTQAACRRAGSAASAPTSTNGRTPSWRDRPRARGPASGSAPPTSGSGASSAAPSWSPSPSTSTAGARSSACTPAIRRPRCSDRGAAQPRRSRPGRREPGDRRRSQGAAQKTPRAAARTVFSAALERRRVRRMRNAPTHAPSKQRTAAAAAMRQTIFAQKTPEAQRDVGGRRAPREAAEARRPDGRLPRRPPRLQGPPARAPAPDRVHQPAGTPEPRDQAPRRRRRDLSERRGRRPTGRRAHAGGR